jgi:hypothetical protein
MVAERALRGADVDAALARLVERAVLDADQADAVRAELADSAAGAPSPGVRGVVVEVAAYLGAVLVAASVVAFLGQSWDDLDGPARLILLGMSGLAALVAGAAVALTVDGGIPALRLHRHAARRRVASVLLALGSLLVALLVQQLPAWSDEQSVLAGAVVCLLLLVGAQMIAPSAIVEMGMLASLLVAAGLAVDLVAPERDPGSDYYVGPDVYLVTGTLTALGLLWAAVVSRRLTVPVLAVALGCAAALGSAFVLAVSDRSSRPVGTVLLAGIALASVALFVWQREWPWLASAVLGLTLVVFLVVAEQQAPALAFLAAGAALLLGSLAAALLGRRRGPDEPDNLPREGPVDAAP